MSTKSPPLPQTLRPIQTINGVSDSQTDTIKVETHYNKAGENIILWSDILIVFKEASHVQNNGTVLSFLRDENLQV
ncbi:hypothetical protein BGZ76_004270, partial [Entomortierella beljakovae]